MEGSGRVKEFTRALRKIIFYLHEDGCKPATAQVPSNEPFIEALYGILGVLKGSWGVLRFGPSQIQVLLNRQSPPRLQVIMDVLTYFEA